MIPKILHYCWFGKGDYTPEIELCLESWKRYCPEWDIRLWNEDNSPMSIPWIHDAYRHQKYAFVADYVRFWALYQFGGVYMDTDMLVTAPLDSFLENSSFIGREDEYNASMGIIGAEKHDPFCKLCLDYYDSSRFNMASPPIITRFITPLLTNFGFVEEDKTQHLTNGLVVYQSDVFYPIHYTENFELNDINRYVTPNTVCIHLWNKSWRDEIQMLASGEYKRGFRMAIKRLVRTPLLPFRYYKKLVKYLIYWILGK